MRRALIAAVGLAGVAAPAIPALAAGPAPVDTGRTAGIAVTAKLPGGDTLRLGITASELSAGPELVIHAERCDLAGDCVSQPYAGALTARALSISESDARARLTTTLDGRPLTISWQPTAQPGFTGSSGTVDSDGPGTFGSSYSGASADATVSFDGLGCTGVGGVGEGAVVDTSGLTGDSIARPLGALHLPDGVVLHC